MTDLVKLYNPANSATLTSEQIDGLQKLTSAEIKDLATAYPNMTMQRAYLLIIDGSKPPAKQLPTLSSFENLWNLREKNGQRNFVAFNFHGTYKVNNNAPVKPKRTEVLDLSETELMSLPGFKTTGLPSLRDVQNHSLENKFPPQEINHPARKVKVTKIKKTKI